MGQIASNLHERDSPWRTLRKSFGEYSRSDVIAARGRFAQMYASDPLAFEGVYLVGRRQFFEVFTEYDLEKSKNGCFLSLPLTTFDIFEGGEKGSGVLDIRDVFCLLCCLCRDGSPSAKLEVSFPLFGPSMTEERVLQMLTSLQRGLTKGGAIIERWEASRIAKLVESMFCSGVHRYKCVSAELCADWFLANDELEDCVSLLISSREVTAARRLTLTIKPNEASNKQKAMKKEVQTVLKQNNGAREREAKQKASGSSSVPKTKDRRGSLARRGSVVAGAKPIEDLARELPLSDMRALQGTFFHTTRSGTVGVTQDQFVTMMQAQFPGRFSTGMLGRMFATFDINGDEYVDYGDFLLGVLRTYEATLEEKIRFLFRVVNAEAVAKDGPEEQEEKQETRLDSGRRGSVNSGRRGSVNSGRRGSVNSGRRGSVSSRDPLDSGRRRGSLSSRDPLDSGRRSSVSSKEGSKTPRLETFASKRRASGVIFSASTPRSDGDTVLTGADMLITVAALVKLIRDSNAQMCDCAQLVELLMKMMDYDGNGEVDCSEFDRACAEMPFVLHNFETILRPSQRSRTLTRRLGDLVPQFCARSVSSVWNRLDPKAREANRTSDWESFAALISSVFAGSKLATAIPALLVEKGHSRKDGFNPFTAVLPELKDDDDDDDALETFNEESDNEESVYNALLNLFRANGPPQKGSSGLQDSIDTRRFFAGIMISFSANGYEGAHRGIEVATAQKSNHFFELFDIDCSGAVDHNEFFELLYSTQLSAQDDAWKAIEVLRRHCDPERGVLTLGTVLDCLKKTPALRQCLGKVFQAEAGGSYLPIVEESVKAAESEAAAAAAAAVGNTSFGDLTQKEIHANQDSENNNQAEGKIIQGLDFSFKVIGLGESRSAPVLPLYASYSTFYAKPSLRALNNLHNPAMANSSTRSSAKLGPVIIGGKKL